VSDDYIAAARFAEESADGSEGVELVAFGIIADKKLTVGFVEAPLIKRLARHFVVFPAGNQATDSENARILLICGQHTMLVLYVLISAHGFRRTA
jgi:hypothetical protein